MGGGAIFFNKKYLYVLNCSSYNDFETPPLERNPASGYALVLILPIYIILILLGHLIKFTTCTADKAQFWWWGGGCYHQTPNQDKKTRIEMGLVQRKVVLRCISAYRTVSTEAVFVLAGVPLIEIAVDECKKVYSTIMTDWSREWKSTAGKVWRKASHNEQLSGRLKGKWTCLLIRNLEVWLETDHIQTGFYLTQVMHGYGAFNMYLFHLR